MFPITFELIRPRPNFLQAGWERRSAGPATAKSSRLSFASAESNVWLGLSRQHRGRSWTDGSRRCTPFNDSTNNSDMNALPIQITAHDIELSITLRKFIQKKISRVSRFAADILSAEVVLREKSGTNGLFSVS